MSDYLVPFPRNELLKTGGNRTMQEMIDFGYGPQDIDLSRPILLVDEIAPVRPLPLKLIGAASELYNKERDPLALLAYVNAAFYIYREPASHDLISPLLMVDGACEFPEPTLASWSNRDAVLTLGMMLGANFEAKNPLVITERGRKRTIEDVATGQVTEKILSGVQVCPQSTLDFVVPRFSDVRLINQPAYQSWLLKAFASSVMAALDDLRKGKAKPDLIQKFVDYLFQISAEKYSLPVAHYAREDETPNNRRLLFGMSF